MFKILGKKVGSENQLILYISIVLGIGLELLVLSFWREKYDYHYLPIVWFLGGLISSLAAIYISFMPAESIKSIPSTRSNNVIYIGLFVGLSLIVAYFLDQLFIKNPYDPMQSDVLPTLQMMTQRLMNGEYPYHEIQFPGWAFSPGYLTMQYLPFIFAEIIHMDYRFFAYIVFILMITFFLWSGRFELSKLSMNDAIIKIILPFLAIKFILSRTPGIFMHSVELLDAAYYLLLAYSFFNKSIYLRGIALACCLLSRYGILFWLPAYGIIYFWEQGWHKTLKLSGIVFGAIIVLYVLPFMTKDPMLFFNGIKVYDHMALSLWSNVPDWYQHIGKPYTLTQGVGFAIYFLDFWEGDMIDKISAIKWIQIASSILVSAITIFIYYVKKTKIVDTSLYLLGSLSVYLTVFYSLIFAPFSYLFIVPFFVLFAILCKVPLYFKK